MQVSWKEVIEWHTFLDSRIFLDCVSIYADISVCKSEVIIALGLLSGADGGGLLDMGQIVVVYCG